MDSGLLSAYSIILCLRKPLLPICSTSSPRQLSCYGELGVKYNLLLGDCTLILNFKLYRAADGATAVMLAAQSGCLPCVRLLIEEHGANPDAKATDGVMAVHLAVTRDHKQLSHLKLYLTNN